MLAALFFFTLARFRRRALGTVGFLARAADLGFFLGALALFVFTQPRVGERMSAGVALVVG